MEWMWLENTTCGASRLLAKIIAKIVHKLNEMTIGKNIPTHSLYYTQNSTTRTK